jgi:hypothetical protein
VKIYPNRPPIDLMAMPPLVYFSRKPGKANLTRGPEAAGTKNAVRKVSSADRQDVWSSRILRSVTE